MGTTKYWLTYFPSLIKKLGYTNTQGPLMSIPPYVSACVFAVAGSFSVTRFNEHGYHVAFFIIIAGVSFALMAIFDRVSSVAVYISGCCACTGKYSAYALLIAWLAKNLSGRIRRSLAVAFVVGLGQIGGAILPFIMHDKNEPNFRQIHTTYAIVMAVIMFPTLLLRFVSTNRANSAAINHIEVLEQPNSVHDA
ncbi:unnamed protein product [Rotaria sp. Silwood1]|nr:unnamed protein product [Rotaria sp. Silwood1]CAF3843411.1 unnamed protein product [Rotaria sp. Silwood1]CAF3880513.1 unnamed protein product [Rotaria sp. Silwood1]CAF3928373.1 unnamed protein product [Rotaria sp. Silwood1]CAF4969327.1 unnamed protein product [Rotaria sp. Silwood1]